MNIYQFVVGLSLGVLLGWLYERAKSLWPCILLHGAYNSALMALCALADPTEDQVALFFSPVLWGVAFVCAFAGFSLLQRMLGAGRTWRVKREP